MSPAEDIALTTAFCVMVVTDLIGNSLVCLVVFRNKDMKTPMNFLLCNLAIADMTVGIFVSPQFIFSRAFVHPEGITGKWLCKFITGGNFLWVGAVASSMTLVSVAFERYFAVVRPVRVKDRMTKKKVKLIALTCWLIGVIWLLPLIITIDYNKERDYCIWILPTEFLQKGYGIGCVIVAGAIPVGVMSFLYAKVIYVLWIRPRSQSTGGTQQALIKARRRVTKIVITVTVIYTLCWLPNLIIQLLATLGPYEKFGSTAYRISVILVTLNSCVNPVVYTLQSQPFRKNLRELFAKRSTPSRPLFKRALCKSLSQNKLFNAVNTKSDDDKQGESSM